MILPEEYTIQKFHQLSGYAKKKHNGRIYEGGCPICKEGKSWGQKRRLYFILADNHIFCHNCGWTGNPINFIQEVQNISYYEILDEAKEYDILPNIIDTDDTTPVESVTGTMPDDSINILDPAQLQYYMSSEIVKSVYDFTNKRNLRRACNRPKTLWVSLKDYIHKNRLILPFYNDVGHIEHYQSRAVLPTDTKLPKYLSKVGSEKTIFNLNNIDPDSDYIFIFEGPIDSCFVKNGVAVAGIQENSNLLFTSKQKQQLLKYPFHKHIWVLDSQQQDRAAKLKTEKLIDQDQHVFIWPDEYGKRFKDFNDIAVYLKKDEIPQNFLLENTYTGLKAKIVLSKI